MALKVSFDHLGHIAVRLPPFLKKVFFVVISIVRVASLTKLAAIIIIPLQLF